MSGWWFLLIWIIGIIIAFVMGSKSSSAMAVWCLFLFCVITIVIYAVNFNDSYMVLTHTRSGVGIAALFMLLSLPGAVVSFVIAVRFTIKYGISRENEMRIINPGTTPSWNEIRAQMLAQGKRCGTCGNIDRLNGECGSDPRTVCSKWQP